MKVTLGSGVVDYVISHPHFMTISFSDDSTLGNGDQHVFVEHGSQTFLSWNVLTLAHSVGCNACSTKC
jgi:hypothetical protein